MMELDFKDWMTKQPKPTGGFWSDVTVRNRTIDLKWIEQRCGNIDEQYEFDRLQSLHDMFENSPKTPRQFNISGENVPSRLNTFRSAIRTYRLFRDEIGGGAGGSNSNVLRTSKLTTPTFQIGQLYSRRNDIHAIYGGQQQGGISTPSGEPFICLFTGDSGELFGYEDGWQPEQRIFLYTGEGQFGDMKFARGNKAIRDHAKNGKDLFLFKTLGSGKPVEFLGNFSAASWGNIRGPDWEGNDRSMIQFHLVQNSSDIERSGDQNWSAPASEDSAKLTLDELREKAFAAMVPRQETNWRKATQTFYERSKDIRNYVLARAKGMCELSGEPAPFKKRNGDPYLEVHHIQKLSDDGLDDPRNCAAVTPTLHREIHHGEYGRQLNQKLYEILKQIEP